MNKVLKWVLGILAVLVVLAVLAGVAFMIVGHWGGGRMMVGVRSFPFFGDGHRFNMPMGRNGGFPMMRFGGFFPLGIIFGGLFWGLVIFLCVLGVISLFRGKKVTQPAAVSPAPAVSAPAEEPSQVSVQTCSNCGRVVQKDWAHCPYCGNNLA